MIRLIGGILFAASVNYAYRISGEQYALVLMAFALGLAVNLLHEIRRDE